MALLVKKLYRGYFWVFDELSDRRTDSILVVSSPLYILAIQASYVYTVKVLGPKLMENRKPFDIRKIMMVYNILQIMWNAYIFFETGKLVMSDPFDCGPINYSTDENSMKMLSLTIQFFYLKLLDLLDTVFFVLRKSNRQVSFLHVYHHSGMILCLWIGIRFFAGGAGVWLPFVNSLVHVLMFTYYLLTAIDSRWKNNIGVKKALTQIQLIQFTIFIFIFGRTLIDPKCGYCVFPAILFVPQNFFMLVLFGDFYLKTYVLKKEKVKNSK